MKKKYKKPKIVERSVLNVTLACKGHGAKRIGDPLCPKTGS